MIWALGAVLAWLVLREWPQALLAAVLVPSWIGGEWSVATDNYSGAPWNIAAQGFLLLALLYFSVTPRERNRHLRAGLVWVGALTLLPFILDVIGSAESTRWNWSRSGLRLPASLQILGYFAAYAPALAIAAFTRKKRSLPVFVAAFWVLALSLISRGENPEHNPWIYLWVGVGACGLCYWGMQEGRRLFINYGTALFAIDITTFYFSDVLDKVGRSMGLILMGVIFLAGGWVLNRLRTDLIARAAVAKGGAE